MEGLGEVEDLFVGDGCVGHFNEVAAAAGHLPFVIGAFSEFEVKAGEGCAEILRLREEGVSVEKFCYFAVAVTEDDGMDAWDFGDLPGEVFAVVGFIDAAVSGDDDEVWFVVAPDIEETFEGGSGGFPGVAFVVFEFFPEGDGGSGEADDGNTNALNCFFKIGDEGFGIGTSRDGVCAEPGEAGDATGGVEILKTVVKFVIADSHGVEAHGVHDKHHGIDGEGAGGDGDAGREAAGLFESLIDAFEGSALDGVADIDEEGVGGGFADLGNKSCDLGEAVIGGFLGEIVVGIDVAVEICGGENGDFCRLGREGDGR